MFGTRSLRSSTARRSAAVASFFESLEERQFLSASPFVIHGSNAQNDTVVVNVTQSNKVSWSVNGQWHSASLINVSEIDVDTGTYSGKTCGCTTTQGHHSVTVSDNPNCFNGKVVVKTTDWSVNDVVVKNNALAVNAYGGAHSYNTFTAYPTGVYKPINFYGGANSTNNLTSYAGNSTLKGGDYSKNNIKVPNGGGVIQGGSHSTNNFWFGAAYTNVIGGMYSANNYYLSDMNGRGHLTAGNYSSNVFYDKDGCKPSGYTVTTFANGSVTYKVG